MKASTVPTFCCCALAAMSTAGLSHWWSVRQFAASFEAGDLGVANPRPQPAVVPPVAAPNTVATHPAPATATPTADQKRFYEALIAKMDSLQTQNRDLLDQLAETNRDLMKLEFRVDTHSESFRPMPVTEDRPFTRNDDGAGVLPPRAEPVALPMHQ